MKLRAGGLALSLIAVWLLAPMIAAAQDLPPGILLLSRIKRHLRQEISRLPDYTCLETAQRLHKAPGVRSALKSVDVLRLEVLNTGKHEMYAAPGESDFREDSPFAFSVSGLAASGLFASFLQTLFINNHGLFTWRGEENDQPGGEALNQVGRRTVRYDYRVPLLTSGWILNVSSGSGTVAMKGSFWVDADSFDLLRLKVQAYDIPYSLEVSDATIILDYARTRIGEADVMLPQTGEVTMLHTSGEMSRNIIDYTHCRSFQAQSTLSFVQSTVAFDNVPVSAAPAPSASTRRVLPLPAGLFVSIRLETAVSEKQTLGTLLAGTVVNDILDKGKLLVPAGSRVTGRLRRLDRDDASGGFTVGMEFTEIRGEQSAFRFYADLQSVAGNSSVESIRDGGTVQSLPGVGFFFVQGSRFTLQPGVRLTWKTRPLSR